MAYFRVIFTILCAICIALAIPAGMLFSWEGIAYCVFGAFLFFVLMLFCKQSQELKEYRAQEQDQDQAQNPASADNSADINQDKK